MTRRWSKPSSPRPPAGTIAAHERQASSGGKYVSHRLQVRVTSAPDAHALRAALRAVDGVMTVL